MKLNKMYENFHRNTHTQLKIINKNNFTYNIILPIIDKYLDSNTRILDIGCGAGTLALYMSTISKNVLGIDISKKAIMSAQKSAMALKLKNISFKVMDFPNDNPNFKFDFILCCEVIEHLKKDELALKIIHDLLKPEGIAIISTPSRNAPLYKLGLATEFDKKVGHLRRYTLEELIIKCKKVGFTIVETKKNEGIIRNFLFLNPIAGKFIRFIKFFFVPIISHLDNLTIPILGESDLVIVLKK